MGGISCYFQFDQSQNKAVIDKENLVKSLEYISHRGPDSSGTYFSPCGRSGLGHVRLSIIDLNNGQQPLSSQDGDVHAVICGEIYDYKRIRDELHAKGYQFKTESDSEIALCLYQEYGLSFFDHLRGEFAVCILDEKKSRLILARDRFGIKPLYYTIVKGAVLVASEIKAFLPMGWEPEWDVDSLLNNGVMFDNRTAFKGVNKLPPAHYMVAKSTGNIQIRPYWTQHYPDKAIKDTRSVKSMVEGVRERLIDSIKQRLVADVPVGIYLNGDIDSSCIAGIVNEIRKENNPNEKVKAFCLAFADDDTLDESKIAERTAEFCDTDFQVFQITETDLLKNFEESVWHAEHHHFSLNAVGKFMLSKMVQDQGYKVVLTSAGADDHFGGNIHYQPDYLREADFSYYNDFGTLSDETRSTKLEEQQGFSKTESDSKDVALRMVNDSFAPSLLKSSFTLTSKFFSTTAKETYGTPDTTLTIAEAMNGISRHNATRKWHPLHIAMSVHMNGFFSNYKLSSLGDRAEMAHSIEARPVFLDHHLCDFVNKLPPSVKIRPMEDGTLTEKWILKQVAKPYVTEEVYRNAKSPSPASSSKAPSKAFVQLLNKLLTKEKIARLGWIDYDAVQVAKENYLITNNLKTHQDLFIVLSYVVISERFNVAPATFEKVIFRKNKIVAIECHTGISSSSFMKKVAIAVVVAAPVVYSLRLFT